MRAPRSFSSALRTAGLILTAIVAATVTACSGGSSSGGSFPPATSADAAVPAAIDGFEVQKVPADQMPSMPTIGGQTAADAAFAVVLGQSQDVYRVVAFRTAQDPASVAETDRLAVVGAEGATIDPATGRDVEIAGIAVRCYDSTEFGDVAKPDKVCVYVDGAVLVFVVTQDQGPGGGEEFARRVLDARTTG